MSKRSETPQWHRYQQRGTPERPAPPLETGPATRPKPVTLCHPRV